MIKKWTPFLNELQAGIYKQAAKKLQHKGHFNRAVELGKHAAVYEYRTFGTFNVNEVGPCYFAGIDNMSDMYVDYVEEQKQFPSPGGASYPIPFFFSPVKNYYTDKVRAYYLDPSHIDRPYNEIPVIFAPFWVDFHINDESKKYVLLAGTNTEEILPLREGTLLKFTDRASANKFLRLLRTSEALELELLENSESVFEKGASKGPHDIYQQLKAIMSSMSANDFYTS